LAIGLLSYKKDLFLNTAGKRISFRAEPRSKFSGERFNEALAGEAPRFEKEKEAGLRRIPLQPAAYFHYRGTIFQMSKEICIFFV
jgi:hypothetical protein